MSDELQPRQLFRVEKYTPTRCPACNKPLTSNSEHGFLLDLNQIFLSVEENGGGENCLQRYVGNQVHGTIVPVVCSRCHARFALAVKEIRHYEISADAALALENEGFVNLQPVQAIGDVPNVWGPSTEKEGS